MIRAKGKFQAWWSRYRVCVREDEASGGDGWRVLPASSQARSLFIPAWELAVPSQWICWEENGNERRNVNVSVTWGKNPHQQALLDCNLTDKSTDCKLVWLLVNIKAASQVISEWEWEHGTNDHDKNSCHLIGLQDGRHRGKHSASLTSLRPHSSLAPVFSWENCPSTGLTGGEAVPVSVS